MSSNFLIDPIKVIVVLPVLNERPNLEVIIPGIFDMYPGISIVVVDDNSIDGTRNFLEQLLQVYPKLNYIRRAERLGIGNAHLTGISHAISTKFEYTLTMDADLTHRIEDLSLFLSVNPSADLIIGSRYLSDTNMVGWSLFRRILTSGGHIATYLAFGTDLDMSSGMRRYLTRTIPIYSLQVHCPNDYAYFFVSAVLYKHLNLHVDQVSIVLNSRNLGKSKMSLKLMLKGIATLFLYASRLKRVH